MRTPERKRLQRPTKVKTIRGTSIEPDDVVQTARRELCRILRHLGSGIVHITLSLPCGVPKRQNPPQSEMTTAEIMKAAQEISASSEQLDDFLEANGGSVLDHVWNFGSGQVLCFIREDFWSR